MFRTACVAAAVCVALPVCAEDDIRYLYLRGSAQSSSVVGGQLGLVVPLDAIEFRVALRVDEVIESPWGDVTLFYPLDMQRTELRVHTEDGLISLFPVVDDLGYALTISSGTTPDGLTADIFDLPRIRFGDGSISVRFLAYDSSASSFPSAYIESLPQIASADTFSGEVDDLVVWRVDVVNSDDGGRPAKLVLRFEQYALPVRCVGDIADSFGFLGSDGAIDFGDFVALLGLLGPCPVENTGCPGDFADSFGNAGPDGEVDFGDFVYLLGEIGTICLIDP